MAGGGRGGQRKLAEASQYQTQVFLQQMSVGQRSERKRMLGQPVQASRVLLVCVYDTLVLQITNDVIYDKFRKFGNIIKLLIFEKNEVTKFFIEFAEVEQAVNAKKDLDGTKLCGTICKMNIYFSNFSNVDLKNQTSEGADYSYEEEERSHFLQRYDILTKSSPEEDTEVFNDLIMQSFDAFSPFARSKTDNPDTLTRYLHRISLNEDRALSEEHEVDQEIKSNINSILDSNSDSGRSYEKREEIVSEYREMSPLGQVKIKETSKSKNAVLAFEYTCDLDIRHVYNLFSNFGNIAGITKKKHHFYVKFRTIEFAAISFTYLNNHVLMGNTLQLYSPDTQDQVNPKENEFSECIFFDPSFDRFTPQKSITINSPSQTLHVSSLKRDICREKTLRSIFQEYGEVETVHILKQSADKNMALVKFYSIEDSFRAIAELHNSVFSGRKMQISFTKSRV